MRRLLGFLGLIVVVAIVGVTVWVLLAAFGIFTIEGADGKAFSRSDLASISAGCGTLALGLLTGVLAWFTRAAVAETRDEARAERDARQAHLALSFDRSHWTMWSPENRWVRIVVTNNGPAQARDVVVTLETITPTDQDPLIYAPTAGKRGISVLPSRLWWKGDRVYPARRAINPQAREFVDVLTYRLPGQIEDDQHPDVGKDSQSDFRIAFQIEEADALTAHFHLAPDKAAFFRLLRDVEYTLHLRATAANAEPTEARFAMQYRAIEGWEIPFDFREEGQSPLAPRKLGQPAEEQTS